jgi:hypothetical protein
MHLHSYKLGKSEREGKILQIGIQTSFSIIYVLNDHRKNLHKSDGLTTAIRPVWIQIYFIQKKVV